jgi:hypothetical protein
MRENLPNDETDGEQVSATRLKHTDTILGLSIGRNQGVTGISATVSKYTAEKASPKG